MLIIIQLPIWNLLFDDYSVFFGSNWSSRCHIVRLSGTKCSILIMLGQRAIRALTERSENTHRAIRVQSKRNQRAIRAFKSESYSRSLKYCVLFIV